MDRDDIQNSDPRMLSQRLQEARKACGLTQQQVAEHLGVARTTIVAIEKGERRVQADELVRLAALYGQSVNQLLRIAPPVEDFVVQLRASGGPAGVKDDEIAAGRAQFWLLCEDYLELERLCDAPLPRKYPPPYDVSRTPADAAAEDVAVAERNRLGLGDGPLLNLRDVLENDVGLRIFAIDLPSKIAAMYAYSEQLGGCIAVNRRHPADRGRLSLGHDYGHFVTSRTRAEVCMGGYLRLPAHERFAEAFGQAFLMPAAGLRRRFHELRRSRTDAPTVADLLTLAHLYFVSFEALMLRLEDLALVRVGTLELLKTRGLRVREAQAHLQLAPPMPPEPILPERYVHLATVAYDRALLNEGQFAKFLRTDRVEARRIADEMRRKLAVTGEHGIEQLDLDLGDVLPAMGGER